MGIAQTTIIVNNKYNNGSEPWRKLERRAEQNRVKSNTQLCVQGTLPCLIRELHGGAGVVSLCWLRVIGQNSRRSLLVSYSWKTPVYLFGGRMGWDGDRKGAGWVLTDFPLNWNWTYISEDFLILCNHMYCIPLFLFCFKACEWIGKRSNEASRILSIWSYYTIVFAKGTMLLLVSNSKWMVQVYKGVQFQRPTQKFHLF